MDVKNLIESFSEFKEMKNIDRETMMNVLEEVFRSYGILPLKHSSWFHDQCFSFL